MNLELNKLLERNNLRIWETKEVKADQKAVEVRAGAQEITISSSGANDYLEITGTVAAATTVAISSVAADALDNTPNSSAYLEEFLN